MNFLSFLQEQSQSAFVDTLKYCKDTQKGELQLRDAINFLVGRLQADSPTIAKSLDEILKNTK